MKCKKFKCIECGKIGTERYKKGCPRCMICGKAKHFQATVPDRQRKEHKFLRKCKNIDNIYSEDNEPEYTPIDEFDIEAARKVLIKYILHKHVHYPYSDTKECKKWRECYAQADKVLLDYLNIIDPVMDPRTTKTLKSVGAKYGISAERVRQLMAQSLVRIKYSIGLAVCLGFRNINSHSEVICQVTDEELYTSLVGEYEEQATAVGGE